MRVDLHVGLHKTATTSIQQTLAHNPEAVARAGAQYPLLTDARGAGSTDHAMAFYAAFLEDYGNARVLGQRGYRRAQARPLFRDRLARAVAEAPWTVLSGEGISRLGAAELTEAREFLTALGARVTPVCFVRSPLEMAVSMIQQTVKGGAPATLRHRRKYPVLAMLRQVFGTLDTHPFSVARRHAFGPVGHFIEALGLGDPAEYEILRANDSLSDQAVRLAGFVNAALPMRIAAGANPLRGHQDTRPLWDIPGAKYALTAAEFAVIAPLVRAENDVYAARLGPEYCDPDPEPATRAEPDPWTPDAVAGAAAALERLSPALFGPVCLFFQIAPEVPRELRDLPLDRAAAQTARAPGACARGLDQTEARIAELAELAGRARGRAVPGPEAGAALDRIRMRLE